jgi:hypothetical protein
MSRAWKSLRDSETYRDKVLSGPSIHPEIVVRLPNFAPFDLDGRTNLDRVILETFQHALFHVSSGF